jgi:nicotinamidase-related amidase
MNVRLVVVAVVAVVAFQSCHRDAAIAYAHMLERAASWAASVQFASDMARERRVPRAYVRDVMSTAAKELRSLQSQIANQSDIPEHSRQESAAVCGQLAEMFDRAERSDAIPDNTEVGELEQRLRIAARDARRLAPSSVRAERR